MPNQTPLNPDALTSNAELFKVASTHHFHGIECLCGFKSVRSRDRTEHIMLHTLAVAQPEVTKDAELRVGSLIEDHTGRLLWKAWRTGGPGVLWLDDEGLPATPVFPARVLHRPEVDDA